MECSCPSSQCLGTGTFFTCKKLRLERFVASSEYPQIIREIFAGQYDHLTPIELREIIDQRVRQTQSQPEKAGCGTQEHLKEQVEAYLETVPDDEGDEWDYKEERVISYREESRRTLMCFLHWLRKGEQDDGQHG